MVLKTAPTRIEVIHSETKSSRVIEVPEPIEKLHAHPYVDVLIAVCANGSYIVRTDREQVTRITGGAFHDCLWAGTQIVGWPLDGYPQIIAAPLDLGDTKVDEIDEDRAAPADRESSVPAETHAEAESQNLRTALSAPTFSERLANWKSKLEESRGAPLPSMSALPPMTETADATAHILERRNAGGWRGEVATWARAIVGRSQRPMPFLDPPILDQLMTRLAIPPELMPAIVLLYGAHLIGGDGVTRYDLASVIEWRWAALAAGPLVTCGIVREKQHRFALRREATHALDEAAPRRGTVIGAGTADPKSTALVAPPSVEAQAIAAWGESLAPAPLFVANTRGHERLELFVLEARIRGAVPVVPDDATATAYGLSIAGRWPGLGVA
jgi:hypothetical protein